MTSTRLPSSRVPVSRHSDAVVIVDHKVTAIAPVRVRHGVEHISERGPHPGPTLKPATAGLGSAGGLEHAIEREQAQQSVEVMAVPCFGVFDE